jgi:hypothetical protein
MQKVTKIISRWHHFVGKGTKIIAMEFCLYKTPFFIVSICSQKQVICVDHVSASTYGRNICDKSNEQVVSHAIHTEVIAVIDCLNGTSEEGQSMYVIYCHPTIRTIQRDS